MRDIHALLEGQVFNNADEINARLTEITSGGRIPELAAAWMQDDPKWRAQQLAYDALETEDPAEALRLAHEAQEIDPDCIDAQRLSISLLPMDDDSRLRLLREVVAKAEKNLGEDFFAENMGHFWGVIETRPFMRALQHLAEVHFQQGQFSDATSAYERLMELNPHDNQGIRFPLLGLYLAQNQPERADRLFRRFLDDEKFLASFAWARVLERWLSGDLVQAHAALLRARKVNPYTEGYLFGRKVIPANTPALFRPGDESDAQVCAVNLAPAWLAHPAFCEWLRAQPQS